MYWLMLFLHGFWGYTLMKADYKLTIFSTRWQAGIFCADAHVADAEVHHGGVLVKHFPFLSQVLG